MEKIVGEIQPQNKAITDYNANCAPLSTAETVKMARAGWSPRGVLGMPGHAAILNIASPRIQISHHQTPATMLKEFTRRFTTKYCLLRRIKFDSSEEKTAGSY